MIVTVLLVAAVVVLGLATIGITAGRINLVALGLLLYVLAVLTPVLDAAIP